MSQTSWEELLRPLREQVFEPLCRELGIESVADPELKALGYAAARSRNLCIYFEHDRGLGYLALGASSQSRSLCGVDLITQRFPRIRLLPDGEQRFTLQEQADFLRNNWETLQTMFSVAEYPNTLAWHAERARAYTERFARDG
jgi:hypothetical protein